MCVASVAHVCGRQSASHCQHCRDGEVQTGLFILPEIARSGVFSHIAGKRFSKEVKAERFTVVESGEASQQDTNGKRNYD